MPRPGTRPSTRSCGRSIRGRDRDRRYGSVRWRPRGRSRPRPRCSSSARGPVTRGPHLPKRCGATPSARSCARRSSRPACPTPSRRFGRRTRRRASTLSSGPPPTTRPVATPTCARCSRGAHWIGGRPACAAAWTSSRASPRCSRRWTPRRWPTRWRPSMRCRPSTTAKTSRRSTRWTPCRRERIRSGCSGFAGDSHGRGRSTACAPTAWPTPPGRRSPRRRRWAMPRCWPRRSRCKAAPRRAAASTRKPSKPCSERSPSPSARATIAREPRSRWR